MSVRVDIKKNLGAFSLEVAFEAGDETLGLLGESGCGKSMTLRSIAGIEMPDEGYIKVNGVSFFDRAPGRKPSVNLSPQERKTALLFQNYNLFPNLTVEENVAAGIGKDVGKDVRARMVAHELRRFSLEGLEARYPLQLSGGQQQRVALARMLAARPGILMLDEPFSALDSHLKGVLEANLVSLFQGFKGSILYVSHDIDEAMRFCDRVAVVDNGRIMEIDTPEELFNTPHSEAAIKLSGCKNVTQAVRVDAHTIRLPRWGIDVAVDRDVPEAVRSVGVRAFYLQRAEGPGQNCYRVVVDQISDSRYDCTLLVRFLRDENQATSDGVDHAADSSCAAADVVDEMKYLHNHAFWRIDKLYTPAAQIPQTGDVLWLRIPPEKLYLACR